MAATGLSIMIVFAALGLATALLAAMHDAIEAWLERRSYRSLLATPDGGDGGLPLPAPAARRRRRRLQPSPALTTSKPLAVLEPVERPAWYENAKRDLAHD